MPDLHLPAQGASALCANTQQQFSESSSDHNREIENEQSLISWLILVHVHGIQSRHVNQLLDVFSSPEKILSCSTQELRSAGLNQKLAKNISVAGGRNTPDSLKKSVDDCFSWLEEEGHFILTLHSPDYPASLAAIPDPPSLLYVKGKPECLDTPMLAMVGSRQPSAGGRRNARCFSRELAASGIAIVSGLALGIDVESHQGAIDGGGSTIAVLGTGIDQTYPARNKFMYEKIPEYGALVTEFNPGVVPVPANFPRRNRIISGLSQGVLVVEAGIRSGSMITARFALEQGRDVFAIPASIHNPLARGCHKLIVEGARLVQGIEEILEESPQLTILAAEAMLKKNEKGQSKNCRADPKRHKSELSKEIALTKNAIGYDPVNLDVLVKETGLEVEQITVALLELELKGLVHREGTGYVLASA